MLQDLTPSSFEEHLGTRFRLHFGGEAPLEAELFQVARHEEHDGPRKQPFGVGQYGVDHGRVELAAAPAAGHRDHRFQSV